MGSLSLSRTPGISRAWITFVMISLMLVSSCSSGADTSTPVSPENIDNSELSPPQSEEQTFNYRLIAAPLQELTPKNSKPLPFTLLGARSEKARIVDLDRNVIRRAHPGGTIGSFRMSPDYKLVLLYFGGAKYAIASADTLEDILFPPTRPPDFDDATGFIWRWLNDTHLVGEAHLPSTDTEGKTASEIDALPPRATLLYIYSLDNAALTPVEIDATLPKMFSAHEAFGWNMTLLTLGEDAERLLGATVERIPRH